MIVQKHAILSSQNWMDFLQILFLRQKQVFPFWPESSTLNTTAGPYFVSWKITWRQK